MKLSPPWLLELASIRYPHDVIAGHFSIQGPDHWLYLQIATGFAIFGGRLKLICRRQMPLRISKLVFLDVFLDSFL